MTAYHISITGVVQGVGFRPFVYNLAQRMGVTGWVLNHSGGVDIEVEGATATVETFITALELEAPPLARITSLTKVPIDPGEHTHFEIRHSEAQVGRYQLISPDVATCPDCVRELFDPADRRYRYPFINCTNCGPRFTIIADIPYDRPNTTMHIFPLCEHCRAEYTDPTNRRFHAQPNACPVCGPQVWIDESTNYESQITNHESLYATPHLSTDTVFAKAKALLLAGKILAIKGLGGFHLACDATNAQAVRLLRKRKRRPHKPFAVMVATMDAVKQHCEVPPLAESLFASPQCPIVLLERRPNSPIVDEVAPNSHVLGMMVPYTPLHHILLRDVGCPLVMTSGNLTEEPIAKDNDEALCRLAPLADAFLLHNRDIYARYDDSVVQIVQISAPESQRIANCELQITKPSSPLTLHTSSFTPQLLRRARGYAPMPVQLPFELPQVFAAGPQLKNTFCLTRDANAFVSQHIGDLETLETLEHYETTLATYQHLFRLSPERVACDLHPDYLSTRFAWQFAQAHQLPTPRPVQHHKAHIAACLADNGFAPEEGDVIGVAFDGTGYGEDGTIWGGEWFVGGYSGFRRAAHLEILPLPGGDAATRNPWRIAVAYLYALLGPEEFPAGQFCPAEAGLIRQQIAHQINTPLTSSMGRLFDAVSALLGVCHTTTYEAQAAIELEQQAFSAWRAVLAPHNHSDQSFAYAEQGIPSPYPFGFTCDNDTYILRLAPLFSALLEDIARGGDIPQIALRFHVTVAEMAIQVCEYIRENTGLNTVALSGGVFQNSILLQLTVSRLTAAGFRVLLHRQLPCNDGCVALGQAVLAGYGQ
ncbi:MAG: carbamoyltransferase HypF [Anaerolineae bacterium]|nr:carbamoyltransferase HypF [Anaerolineae bacterium]